MARAKSGLSFHADDGIIQWFDGPEWDQVAAEEYEKAASDLEELAKRNAPWSDRTGDARDGLSAAAFHEQRTAGVYLYHTVEYGKWLELIQNGRFAIIGPTLEEHGRRITYNAIRRIRSAREGRR